MRPTSKWLALKGIMAPRKTTPKTTKKKKSVVPPVQMEEVWQSTRTSVKALLETLAKGIDSPAAMPEHWERLFGTKDSAVANLQKLVALLVELRVHFHDVRDDEDVANTAMDSHEMEMLEAWLNKQKASTTEDA